MPKWSPASSVCGARTEPSSQSARSRKRDGGVRALFQLPERFTSPDWSNKPLAFAYGTPREPQTLNLYEYVRNNRLQSIDVDGHDWHSLRPRHQWDSVLRRWLGWERRAWDHSKGPSRSVSSRILHFMTESSVRQSRGRSRSLFNLDKRRLASADLWSR